MRIGIAGCAGTGKSLLAETLAEALGIPFLPSKVITGEILRRDGYDYASGQQVEKFLATHDHQNELLKKTIEQQQGVEEFVTDRTAIDLAAYAIVEMEGPLKVKRYLDQCEKLSERCTHIVFCPWVDIEIIDNNKRTLDPWYQFTVHSVQLEVIKRFNINMLNLMESDVEDRVRTLKSCFEKLT